MLSLLCSLTCSPSAHSRIWWIYDCCTLSTQINKNYVKHLSCQFPIWLNSMHFWCDLHCLVLFIMRKSWLTSRKKQTNDTCNYKNEKGITVMLFFNYSFFRKGLLQRCLVPYIKKLIGNTFTREGWGDVWQIMQGKIRVKARYIWEI